MRIVLLLGLGVASLAGQTCVPAPISPAGQVSGTLSAGSCSLSDGTPYDAYRLVLPTRGNVQIAMTPPVPNIVLMLQDSTGAQIASGVSLQRQVEAGTYTVVVNGQTATATWTGPAAYVLQSSFSAEPGMWCSNFAALGINQTVSGQLGASGCAMPDGTPYEAYALTTFGGGALTVSVKGTGFQPSLIVRADDGTAIASDPASVSFLVTAFTQYQVVVATADTTGSYQVTTSFQPGAMETCRPQKTLSDTAADNGTVTAASCSVVIDSGGDEAFFNYYNVTVSAGGTADFAVSSSDFGPMLYLLDAAGNTVTIDSAGGGSSGATTRSEIIAPLSPGNYILEVFSNYSSGGKYSLNYTFTAGAPQPCTPAAYTIGAGQSGNLSPASCRTAYGLSDLYTVTLPASGNLSVSMTSNSFPTQIAIRDAKDNLLVTNQDIEGLGVSQIGATLPAGTYTIVTAANSGAGFYQLTSRFVAADIAPCGQGQTVALNGGYIQNLGVGSCVGWNGEPSDVYQFTLPSPAVTAAVMTSSDVDGFLTLTDSNGSVLRSDQNSYGSNDPFIVQYLPAGTYKLTARAVTNTVGGLYQLTLLGSLGARPPFCGSAGPLVLGGSISGTLGISSCQYTDNSFADVYQIQLANDTQVDLRLNSGAFDAFLILLDAKGNLVASDDDSGGGTNARVIQQLTAGTYYVVAKQFANYYPGGKYTLSLATYQ